MSQILTPTQRRAFDFAAEMDWQIDEEQIRIVFFAPESDQKIATALTRMVPGWDAEKLDDGRIAVWTYWWGKKPHTSESALAEWHRGRKVAL